MKEVLSNTKQDGWDLVREEKDDGVDVEITNYLVPQGEVLAFQRDGDWFYLHGDGLSSTQLVTDENGAQVGRAVYGAWGETLSFNESVPGSLDVRFVGGLGVRNDAATGLIWMRHRWYDSELGRFISRDPIGLMGGTNLYSYGANNPMTFFDPLGLQYRKGSPEWCADRLGKILSKIELINDKIFDMNNNGMVTKGRDVGMSRAPLPYDIPATPGHRRNTIRGHLTTLQEFYDQLERQIDEYEQSCGGGPPPGCSAASIDKLNPKWIRNDPSRPPTLVLPSPPPNLVPASLNNEPGLDLYLLPLMLISPLRSLLKPKAAPAPVVPTVLKKAS